MLHGFPDTPYTWSYVRPRVAEQGFRVVTPFMRGYHPTEVPARDADPETISRDVLALIDALGASSAIVVGHDWGAVAAYGAAALSAEKVRKVVAIGTPQPATVRPTLQKIWAARHLLAYKLPGAAARFAKNDFAALPAIYRRWSPTSHASIDEFAAIRACFSKRESLDAAFGYYRSLSAFPPAVFRVPVSAPSVVFAGLDDPIVTPADCYRAKKMFANDYVVEEMPGGHFMHHEHPDLFVSRLIAHLR
jgi:pimeloyl-ACP methyl ester carboxylesterase